MQARPTACAACKHQRRKCTKECILAPYFPTERSVQFQCVHRLFGVSNLLRFIDAAPASLRGSVVESMIFEAMARSHDPVSGSVAIIRELKAQIEDAKLELEHIVKEICSHRLRLQSSQGQFGLVHQHQHQSSQGQFGVVQQQQLHLRVKEEGKCGINCSSLLALETCGNEVGLMKDAKHEVIRAEIGPVESPSSTHVGEDQLNADTIFDPLQFIGGFNDMIN